MVAEGQWLGERTHEGFGRFRLDDTLPGVTNGAPASTAAAASVPDEPEDAIAATTRQWFGESDTRAKAGGSPDRRPSLSQWLDLVADLERNEPDALTSRQNPTTSGGKNWNHPDAVEVLSKLAAVRRETDRAAHARLFVRWLRAEMRRGAT